MRGLWDSAGLVGNDRRPMEAGTSSGRLLLLLQWGSFGDGPWDGGTVGGALRGERILARGG
jgi:hypothetical protein